jgi:agmatine deiminase
MTRSPDLTSLDSPLSLGYRMPAEWEPHAATWIAWPHNRSDWPGKFESIPWVYAEMVRHLVAGERVEVLVQSGIARRNALEVLRRAHVPLPNARFHPWPTNRGWTRDFLPLFVSRKRSGAARVNRLPGVTLAPARALVKWRFNGWAKYPDWRKDAAAAERIVRHVGLPCWRPALDDGRRKRPVVLEGGSIDVNGRGTLLTTEECLLGRPQQRNPGLTRKDLERVLGDYLGISKVIWLGRGIVGDDTHGHVDDIARFVAPDTVVVAVERNPKDPNHQPLAQNLARLKASTDQDGRPLRVVEMPMPAPVVFRGRRLPASYANFYVANGVVLVPTFNDANDRLALNILAQLFPGRLVVPIYCGDFIWGLGAIHCATQQQPAG